VNSNGVSVTAKTTLIQRQRRVLQRGEKQRQREDARQQPGVTQTRHDDGAKVQRSRLASRTVRVAAALAERRDP
jgi:hypothetical protein